MVPIQFITHSYKNISYEESARLALKGGCRWIQLRVKDATDEELEPLAIRLRDACREKEAIFVLDDRVELCKKIKADGVHLGKNDMPISKVRDLLGQEYIIGGTANTMDDIRCLRDGDVDYIGYGPFRFTTTKEKLAPILGIEGYRTARKIMDEENINIPLVAIGGIMLDDVPLLLDTGVNGIAVSGAIIRAENPVKMMQNFLNSDNE